MTSPMKQMQTVFERDREEIKLLKRCKDNALDACNKCIGKRVGVQTLDGSYYEGQLLGADKQYMYLQVATPNTSAPYAPATYANDAYRQYPYYYNPYYNPYSAVLPLVLFDLLAITLLL